MAGQKRPQITDKDVTGLKYFDKLVPLLEPLHDVGCARDKAGNRTLHFDQYCLLVLLFLFSPIVRSLRAIQQASQLERVQKRLGCARASLGSLSESSHLFNARLLEPVIAELGQQLQPLALDPRLKEIGRVITLVDGTLLKALPRITQAMWLETRTGTVHHAWRLHTHFELLKYVPRRLDLTNGRNSGNSDEKEVLRQHLEPDHCYVLDRGYEQFTLFNEIHRIASSYVCRVRDNSAFEVVEERVLTAEAQQAGVLRDVLVRMGLSSPEQARPDHPMRLVMVRIKPHEKRSHRKGNTGAGPSDGILRIATNLLDVPAELIALIYWYRWTIELFFRFFKHILGCRHLLSDDPNAITIQTYCAIIACMLISLYTGRKPTLRTHELICYYLMGWATEEELLRHLEKLKKLKKQPS